MEDQQITEEIRSLILAANGREVCMLFPMRLSIVRNLIDFSYGKKCEEKVMKKDYSREMRERERGRVRMEERRESG